MACFATTATNLNSALGGFFLKWFKHYTNAHKGGVLQDLYLKFGVNEGHGLYFRFIEYLCDKWDGSAEPRFRILESELRSFLKLSRKSLRSFAETFTKLPENSFEVSENFCEIFLPKLAEILHRDALPAGVRLELRQHVPGVEEKKRKKKKERTQKFESLESLLANIPEETKKGWAIDYPAEFIADQLDRAWTHYSFKPPKIWGQALSGWLKRGWKWEKDRKSSKAPDTGGWGHLDGVS